MGIVLNDIVVRIPVRTEPLFSISAMEVPSGSRVLIHGPSGSGKTTLLHLISGQFLPDQGRIRVLGQDLTGMDAEARCRFRRRHMGIVFQRLNLIDHLTPLENVRLGLPGASKEIMEKAVSALAGVDLESRIHQRAATLSLGEQQRVAVARVLASKAEIVLADEPTSSLDLRNAEAVVDALCEASPGRTLIVVSHDQRIHRHFDEVWDFSRMTAR